jgi:hypothetical protein
MHEAFNFYVFFKWMLHECLSGLNVENYQCGDGLICILSNSCALILIQAEINNVCLLICVHALQNCSIREIVNCNFVECVKWYQVFAILYHVDTRLLVPIYQFCNKVKVVCSFLPTTWHCFGIRWKTTEIVWVEEKYLSCLITNQDPFNFVFWKLNWPDIGDLFPVFVLIFRLKCLIALWNKFI